MQKSKRSARLRHKRRPIADAASKAAAAAARPCEHPLSFSFLHFASLTLSLSLLKWTLVPEDGDRME